jgi:hypothetical protein
MSWQIASSRATATTKTLHTSFQPSRFPLGDYQGEFLVPGIPENRHRFTAIYRLGPARLAGWLLTIGDAALECRGFCVDLLSESSDFLGISQ